MSRTENLSGDDNSSMVIQKTSLLIDGEFVENLLLVIVLKLTLLLCCFRSYALRPDKSATTKQA